MNSNRFDDIKRFLDLSSEIGKIAKILATATLEGGAPTKPFAEAILTMTKEQEKLEVEMRRGDGKA